MIGHPASAHTITGQEVRNVAARGKYARLYCHLSRLEDWEWRASFDEIEAILGFSLPKSARTYPAWWGNERGPNISHTHSLAWTSQGWGTSELDLEAERVAFRRWIGVQCGERGYVASIGKYAPLYRHFSTLGGHEWQASFDELEAILRFSLPKSARKYMAWWANERKGGNSQKLAWSSQGWKTAHVDLKSERVVFSRLRS